MRPICQLASSGVAFTADTDPNDPQVGELLRDQKEWVLLFQVELGALEQLGLPPEPAGPGDRVLVPRFFIGGGDRLYFWIREADLSARAFDRVWAVRHGYHEEEEEQAEQTAPTDAEVPEE